MIEPDFFGCSAKLAFAETVALAATGNGGGDFSTLACDGTVVTSIDRVHRCARDWGRFARIALNHAFGDVACAGAAPIQAMLSYDFGADAQSYADHSACSAAFADELAVRGVALGKCHSGRSSGVTAVTIAVIAAAPARPAWPLRRGRIFMSRPIGALKLLYLSEMGIEVDNAEAVNLLERPGSELFQRQEWAAMTDVSGHGLLGAAMQVALRHGIDIELALSDQLALSADVLQTPVECLQNPPTSYGRPLDGIDPKAVALATLRETAGPFVAFLEDDAASVRDAGGGGIEVGRYGVGRGSVRLAWHA